MTSVVQLEAADWDTELEATGSPFRFSHRAAAGEALEAAYPSYRHQPCRVDYDDGGSLLFPLVRIERRLKALTIVAGMPLGLEGTPVVRSGRATAAHLQALFDALGACGRLELHGGTSGSPPEIGMTTAGSTHVLDLTLGFDAIWNNSFSAKTRNMCRKAERGGLSVAMDCSTDAITAYASLYRLSAVGWGYREPPYPDALFEMLLATDHAELWVARVDGEIVAGAVMLLGSEDLMYWSGAMNRDFRHVAPSNAIIRAVVETACARNLSYLDFGASSGLSGVEAFKRSFGAQPREYRSISLSTWRYRHLERLGRAGARVREKTIS